MLTEDEIILLKQQWKGYISGTHYGYEDAYTPELIVLRARGVPFELNGNGCWDYRWNETVSRDNYLFISIHSRKVNGDIARFIGMTKKRYENILFYCPDDYAIIRERLVKKLEGVYVADRLYNLEEL